MEDLTPPQLLQIAISRGVDTDQLKELMQLQREWKADQAREAFTAAMNAFRAESITITKSKSVFHGEKFMYRHALLSNIVEAVAPKLGLHGLSHRWETKQDGAAITVTCILTHKLGHSISTALTASPDTSGAKNGIQAIGSTVTYLQRYTFLALTGLAAKDTDNDGDGDKDPTLDDGQVADLESLIQEVGADKAKFMRYLRVDSLDQILAKNYEAVVKELERKRR
jgi:hypothetical protein